MEKILVLFQYNNKFRIAKGDRNHNSAHRLRLVWMKNILIAFSSLNGLGSSGFWWITPSRARQKFGDTGTKEWQDRTFSRGEWFWLCTLCATSSTQAERGREVFEQGKQWSDRWSRLPWLGVLQRFFWTGDVFVLPTYNPRSHMQFLLPAPFVMENLQHLCILRFAWGVIMHHKLSCIFFGRIFFSEIGLLVCGWCFWGVGSLGWKRHQRFSIRPSWDTQLILIPRFNPLFLWRFLTLQIKYHSWVLWWKLGTATRPLSFASMGWVHVHRTGFFGTGGVFFLQKITCFHICLL